MNKYTSTPYHLHDMEQGIICNENGLAIIDCNSPALEQSERNNNAAFIVRACNSFEVYKKALTEIAKGKFHIGNDLHGNVFGPPDAVMCRNIAALALAEGGKQ